MLFLFPISLPTLLPPLARFQAFPTISVASIWKAFFSSNSADFLLLFRHFRSPLVDQLPDKPTRSLPSTFKRTTTNRCVKCKQLAIRSNFSRLVGSIYNVRTSSATFGWQSLKQIMSTGLGATSLPCLITSSSSCSCWATHAQCCFTRTWPECWNNFFSFFQYFDWFDLRKIDVRLNHMVNTIQRLFNRICSVREVRNFH